ncbi:hypothetical protein Pcinc_028686 [Petrolisthes cinctipes]|uniref:Uncharacterized protein n=1 Tax=Petrolisthes cinctipes TaxID=88211 RepID=A0AAE1K8Y7_PETCI|nr:hypothetical protein Pcinc_028686 [Petrolisthes cinctipes]
MTIIITTTAARDATPAPRPNPNHIIIIFEGMRTRQSGGVEEEKKEQLEGRVEQKPRGRRTRQRGRKVEEEQQLSQGGVRVEKEAQEQNTQGRGARWRRGGREHKPSLPLPNVDRYENDDDGSSASHSGTPDSAISSSQWSVSSQASSWLYPRTNNTNTITNTDYTNTNTADSWLFPCTNTNTNTPDSHPTINYHHINSSSLFYPRHNSTSLTTSNYDEKSTSFLRTSQLDSNRSFPSYQNTTTYYEGRSSDTPTPPNTTTTTYSNGVGLYTASSCLRSATPQVRRVGGAVRGKMLTTAQQPYPLNEENNNNSSGGGGGGGWVVIVLYVCCCVTASLDTHQSQVGVSVCGWLAFGMLSDLIPTMALTLPPLIPLLHHLLLHLSSCSFSLPNLPLGLLGCQVLAVNTIANKRSVSSKAGVLSMLGLLYGVASYTIPKLVPLINQHIGYVMINLVVVVVVVTVVSVMIATGDGSVNRFSHIINNSVEVNDGGKERREGEEGNLRRLMCWAVMKMCVTIPSTMILPHLQELVVGCDVMRLNEVVSLGLLLTPVVVMPVLLLCTSPHRALTTTAITLTTLYTALVSVCMTSWDVSTWVAVLLVPICGLSGLVQTLLYIYLLPQTPIHHYHHTPSFPLPFAPHLGPSTVLAINLSLHTLARLTAPHLAHWLLNSPWPLYILGHSSYSLSQLSGNSIVNTTLTNSLVTLALSRYIVSGLSLDFVAGQLSDNRKTVQRLRRSSRPSCSEELAGRAAE